MLAFKKYKLNYSPSTLLSRTFFITLLLTLSACSSSANQHASLVQKNSSSNYLTAKSSGQVISSDHQLMMSLLNRPVTPDQAMMLSLQKRADDSQNVHIAQEKFVLIKGESSNNTASKYSSTSYAYKNQIEEDINAVSIIAPKK